MIHSSHPRTLFFLSSLAACLTLVIAGYSLFDMSVYKPTTPDPLLPGAVSQDIISMVAAAGLLICLAAIQGGREMAWLIWVGFLGYLFYAYALYCFEGLFNPLYLGYVAILGLTVYALILFFAVANLDSVRPREGKRVPRRGAAFLFLVLVVMFVMLWLSILIPAMQDLLAPDGSTIFVLDLAFFLPLLSIEAVLLFREKPLGDALSIPLLIKVGTLGLSVLIGTLLAPVFGQSLDLASIGIYALVGLGPLLFAVQFVRSLVIGYSSIA